MATINYLVVTIAGACAAASPHETRPQPEANPARVVVLARNDEPGERIEFTGVVLDYDGRPLAKAAVIAYHADARGLYNPPNSPSRVPRLRGVAITDEQGRFVFRSIKPGPYPQGTEPAHIHLVITAPAHHPRYVDIWFEGDPLITPALRNLVPPDGSETILVVPRTSPDGALTFQIETRLIGN